jgi:hypothetical protein
MRPGTSRIRPTATVGASLPYRLEDEGGHPRRVDRLKHLRDDDLVLYHDGEIRTAPAERHLHVCRGCRDRLAILDLELSRLSLPRAAQPLPPPSAGIAPRPPKLPAWRRLFRRLACPGSFRRG